MAAGSLLALLDDIATLLDDISVMSKIAAKKTAGVLGDDLAVNAEQVGGVRAERELPVVWAVAKGALLNKVIIVPLVLLLSVVLPWMITPVLILGGLFLCFEGAEKVWHSIVHKGHKDHAGAKALIADNNADLVALEKDKIKGAIRTDFILSLEIIVIALSTMADVPFAKQAIALAFVAFMVTVVVYGLVAVIVKLDDVGIYCSTKGEGLQVIGRFLLWFSPAIMKALTFIGTVAMFLVGGGILTHSVEHYLGEAAALSHWVHFDNAMLDSVVHALINGLAGALAGIAVLAIVSLFPSKEAASEAH